MLTSGTRVWIEPGHGQSLLITTVNRRAVVVKDLGPIVLVEIEGVGLRGCIPEYAPPIVTQESLEARLSA